MLAHYIICGRLAHLRRLSTLALSETLHEIKLSNGDLVSFTREGDLASNLVLIGIHGGPGSHKDLRFICKEAKEKLNTPLQFMRFDLPGYNNSSKLTGAPSSENFSKSIIESLNTLDLITRKRIVILGHSLGGHIAIDLSSRIESAAVVLIASVACRPHKAIFNEWFGVVRWLGLNVYHPIYGSLIRWYVDILYKRFLGFPKSAKKSEIVLTQQRIANLNWAAFNDQIRTSQTPIMLAYALNDHLIQSERFEELRDLLAKVGKNAENKIKVFEDGGHNIQKTKAVEIVEEMKAWLIQLEIIS